MTLDELRGHSGFADCARLLTDDETDDPVGDVVREQFDGDASAFEAWARDFLRAGCGVPG